MVGSAIHVAMEGGRDKPSRKVGHRGDEGVDEGVREGRTAFVRVATWIRRSRGRTEEDRCEGGRCFCPTSNTFQDGNVLARFLRNGQLDALSWGTRAHARTTHAYRRVSARRGATGRERERERERKRRGQRTKERACKRDRERRRRRRRRRTKRKSEKEIPIRLDSVAGPLLSYVGDEKAQL